MKRAHPLILVLFFGVLAMSAGCADATGSRGQARAADPGMADAVGPRGMSRDSNRYIANDPP